MAGPVLVWFRDDHRVSDNPALRAAIASGRPILCCFILDEASPGLRPLGGASRWWLHGSLAALDASLKGLGAELMIFTGAADGIIERIASEAGIEAVFWNRRYTAAEIAVDSAIKASLKARGVRAESFNGRLLNEPWAIKTKSGTPFQVYTPYLRTVLAQGEPPPPLPSPPRIDGGSWPADLAIAAASLDDLRLEPSTPNWAAGFHDHWTRGEAAAQAKLDTFLRTLFKGYAENRNLPAVPGTSRLSPHLRFGEISPRQVWHGVQDAIRSGHSAAPESDAEKLLAEVIWRDFCYQLLHDNPHLSTAHHNRRFERFPWRNDGEELAAWQRGRTGYPIVDAGLRQLWQTGWMHNRVRMIAASFLVKHLLVDWREGEAWFWDTLVDADPANNAFSWQWIAGSGPDSAPFHRIFNPVSQGEKFDPDGTYVRGFLPELSRLPASLIHKPWEATAAILRSAGITLGETYPTPIVVHDAARARALAAARAMRDAA
ncbi:MAG TPA: deoxyribodipyrimidine photo-lyase [Microvirga sp.]